MIHAYISLKGGRDTGEHGVVFHSHMKRINDQAGTNITVYHSFNDEVSYLRKYIWRCSGATCQAAHPYCGYVSLPTKRRPSKWDKAYRLHLERGCTGTFQQVSDNFADDAKQAQIKASLKKAEQEKEREKKKAQLELEKEKKKAEREKEKERKKAEKEEQKKKEAAAKFFEKSKKWFESAKIESFNYFTLLCITLIPTTFCNFLLLAVPYYWSHFNCIELVISKWLTANCLLTTILNSISILIKLCLQNWNNICDIFYFWNIK